MTDDEIVKEASEIFSDLEAPSKNNFIKKKVLIQERNVFISKILIILAGYVGLTLWLNSIRATAPLWFVWVLIIIQFLLYFLVFSVSYERAKVCGLKRFGLILFIILATLGRVEDWELFIIPSTIIIVLIVSAKNKNVSTS